jgi:hypothetical protein
LKFNGQLIAPAKCTQITNIIAVTYKKPIDMPQCMLNKFQFRQLAVLGVDRFSSSELF